MDYGMFCRGDRRNLAQILSPVELQNADLIHFEDSNGNTESNESADTGVLNINYQGQLQRFTFVRPVLPPSSVHLLFCLAPILSALTTYRVGISSTSRHVQSMSSLALFRFSGS
jgi:hypothetical protein